MNGNQTFVKTNVGIIPSQSDDLTMHVDLSTMLLMFWSYLI